MSESTYHILIFEDDIDLVFQWKEAFADKDIQVSHTNSLAGALQHCNQTRFDAIVSDLFIDNNGGKTSEGGLILLHKLQEALSSRHVILHHNALAPRIVVSGCSNIVSNTLKRMTDRLGSRLFMLKPFSPEVLVQNVFSCISESQK